VEVYKAPSRRCVFSGSRGAFAECAVTRPHETRSLRAVASLFARLYGREHPVNLRHDSSIFSYRRRNTLGRARPHVADGKNARPARLKRQGITGSRASTASPIVPNSF
jgi:hypothetical protein